MEATSFALRLTFIDGDGEAARVAVAAVAEVAVVFKFPDDADGLI